MERVRLRLQNAEEVVAKAKDYAVTREEQLQKLKEKGRSMPPEATILGCWQVIEKTILCNVDPRRYPDFQIGDYRTYFTVLAPDGFLQGESREDGQTFTSRHAGLQHWPGTIICEITGRIISQDTIRYRERPVEGKTFTNYAQGFRGRQLPRLLEAQWHGWEMEGKGQSALGETAFKAVRIGD